MGRDHAKQGGTLHHLKSVLAEVGQPLVRSGDGRRIDHQRALRVTAVVGNERRVLVKVDVNTLLLQCGSQVAGRAVISSHAFPFGQEITFQGCHADAASSYKV